MPDLEAMPADQDVQQASTSQLASVAQILGSAFTHDPVLNWFLPAPRVYADLFMGEAMNLYRHHDHIFINRSQTGAAMWLPPGITTATAYNWRTLIMTAKMALHGGFKSLSRGQYLTQAMEQEHLKEPHYYLHAIGADLDHQGRGIGSALLKHGTSVCDETGYPAYLESSNIKNNPLYERYGFEITGEINLPENGPTMWLMRRPGKSSAK